MRILLLLSALVLPPRQATPALERISVRADTDSVVAAAILGDIASAFIDIAHRNGYDPAKSLDGWLEPSYLAMASRHPEVPEYFTHRAAYAAELSSHMDSIVTAIVTRRLAEAGIAGMQSDSMRTAFMDGFHRHSAAQQQVFEMMRRQARIALRLHEFLLKAEPHLAVDPKTNKLLFDRPADHRRYDELSIAIDAANEQLARATTPQTMAPVPPAPGGGQR